MGCRSVNRSPALMWFVETVVSSSTGERNGQGNLGHYPSISLEGVWGWGRSKKSHWIGPAYWPGFVNYNTMDHDDVICPPLQSAHTCSAELWFAQGKRTYCVSWFNKIQIGPKHKAASRIARAFLCARYIGPYIVYVRDYIWDYICALVALGQGETQSNCSAIGLATQQEQQKYQKWSHLFCQKWPNFTLSELAKLTLSEMQNKNPSFLLCYRTAATSSLYKGV